MALPDPQVPGFRISIIDMAVIAVGVGAFGYWVYLYAQASTLEQQKAAQTAEEQGAANDATPTANPASEMAALSLLADIFNSPGVGVANVTGDPTVGANQAAVVGTASAGTGG